MYDLCGIPSIKCGPYVGVPEAKLPTEDDICQHLAFHGIGATPYDAKLLLADKLKRTVAVIDRMIYGQTDLHTVVRKYHFDLLSSFDLPNYYREFFEGGAVIESELHFYPNRALSAANLHHDSVGDTHFVILHYYNDETIYGPEFTFATHQTASTPPPNHWKPEYGATADDSPWPNSLRLRVKQDRTMLTRAWRNSALVRHALIPPNGAIGFVDELIHHSTPHLDNRPPFGPGSGLYTSVQIPVGAQPKPTEYSLGHFRRPRSFSHEKANDSLNQLALDATNGKPRTFMRVWVRVRRADVPRFDWENA